MVGLCLGLGQNKEKKQNKISGRPLARIRAIYRERRLCGRPLVRARAKKEKDTFVIGLWLGLLQ